MKHIQKIENRMFLVRVKSPRTTLEYGIEARDMEEAIKKFYNATGYLLDTHEIQEE